MIYFLAADSPTSVGAGSGGVITLIAIILLLAGSSGGGRGR